jgi:hypothetical protein
MKITFKAILAFGAVALGQTKTWSTFQLAREQVEKDMAETAAAMEAQYESVIHTKEYEGAGCSSVSDCQSNPQSALVAAGADDMAAMPQFYQDGVPRTYKVPSYRYSSGSSGKKINTERMKKVTCTANVVKSYWSNHHITSGFWANYYGDQTT